MVDIDEPKHYIRFSFRNGNKAVEFSLAELCLILGLPEELPDEVAVGMARDAIDMRASFQPKEADYPGITVDASTRQAGDVYLGNFELPCESYPTRIAARLYAGCHKYETDGPIAIVTHEVTDDARVMYRSGKYGNGPRPMRKLVYVDHDLADSRTWKEPGEEKMPERPSFRGLCHQSSSPSAWYWNHVSWNSSWMMSSSGLFGFLSATAWI